MNNRLVNASERRQGANAQRRGPDPSVYKRPDPDALLERIEQMRRGRLKVFLGLAPGVGKTYAMLQEAHTLRDQGVDVVVGVIDTHDRAETAEILKGLEIVPLRPASVAGVSVQEFDPDAVLARHPELCLVDELAHTNAPGSARAKRYQDVEWLLDQGIHILTTLNVQHLESLNDDVFQITGVRVRETVQDSILDEAAEIRLVDLSPEELLSRLEEGKIYSPDVAARAKEAFFRPGNLAALREIALRVLSDHVDRRLADYMREHAIEAIWRSRERVMVAVAPLSNARRLVRRGFRLASRLRADLHVVYVQPSRSSLSPEARQSLERALSLATEMGAEIHILEGNVYSEILRFVREHQITNAVLGVSQRHLGIIRLRPSLLEALQRAAPDMDILLVGH